jgi:small subunit ribosomal protein S24e
MVVDVYHG